MPLDGVSEPSGPDLEGFSVYPRKLVKQVDHWLWVDKVQDGREMENDPQHSFSVVTYNILADKFIKEGYTHLSTPQRYLKWRHPRIMKELLEYDADIVCLQEVEDHHFQDKLQDDLSKIGKPSQLFEKTSPDWAPSLKLGYDKSSMKADPERFRRTKHRSKKKAHHEAAKTLLELSFTEPAEAGAEDRSEPVNEMNNMCTFLVKGSFEPLRTQERGCHLSQSYVSEMNRLLIENRQLKAEKEQCMLNEKTFSNNDAKVLYYTGLPSFSILMCVFNLVADHMEHSGRSVLTKFQKLLLVLMRLRLNLPIQDLAYRFQISKSTASETFLSVLNVMYYRLKFLIFWPEREELRKTMPMEFRKTFGVQVAVIIDCFEIFTDRPSNLLARAETWSSYKHHNTVKFLIGITPQGVIAFLSEGYGGRCSDKFIPNDCGFLNKILPGDVILADRGFDIQESVGMIGARALIPAFTEGKSQLSPLEIESTRKIAHVRIHVERVIGTLRNKYTILQDTMPIDFFSGEIETPTADKIVTVCCCLINLCESVIPFD